MAGSSRDSLSPPYLSSHLSEVIPLVVTEDHGLPAPVIGPGVVSEPVHALVPGHVLVPGVAPLPVHTEPVMSGPRGHVRPGQGATPGRVIREVTVVIRAR